MYKILKKTRESDSIFTMVIKAPWIARSCLPGQFLIVKVDSFGERIPLTIADYDRGAGTITVAVQEVGLSTKKMAQIPEGGELSDVVGPLGNPSELLKMSPEDLKKLKICFIGGGLGIAPIYPQVKWMGQQGVPVDVIMGARTKDLLFWEEEMKEWAENVYVATDDGSFGFHGRVTSLLEDLVKNQGKQYGKVVVIGPTIMMKFVCELTGEKGLAISTIASLSPLMVDGTGMCGACRVLVDGNTQFACVDGPEFDGHKVDFDLALRRMRMYRTAEGRAILEGERTQGDRPPVGAHEKPAYTQEEFDPWKRIPVSEQDPLERSYNFEEVCLGYTDEEARLEASRCLNCNKPSCVEGCPVHIEIPQFIEAIGQGKTREAFKILTESSCLPAVCGRVCPQETQCEGRCVRGKKGDPLAIGKLERYAADWARNNGVSMDVSVHEQTGKKVAIIGSGPAGLACAGDLAKLGHEVTIFESLHMAGGVLQYGIPEFRLPKDEVVAYEVDNVKKLGIKIETDVLIGQSVTISELMDEEGFDAVFIASGAGLPRFMDIPGENLNGVYSANEFLTRSNLMHAFDPAYDTDVCRGKNVIVVGGGNVAMDAARTVMRLGGQSRIVYRRGENELPARKEEVQHAKEEGVIFNLLQNPVRFLGDDQGWVSGAECIQMILGACDASGRCRPIPVEGSEFVLSCDAVIMALGTMANPRAARGLDGLEINKKNGIVVNEDGMTNLPGVFAGGDSVTGSATVIKAMGAGRTAAQGIDRYLKSL